MADLSSYINIRANAVISNTVASNSVVSTTGNVTGNYFIGNGSTLTSLPGANVTGTVANATYATSAGSATTATSADTVTTNAQPNITSVGTLSSVSVTANITTGNLTLANGQINTTYTPGSSTGASILSQGANTNGGAGYFDFLKATNQSGGSTNPNKWFRVNSTGALEIINSNYSATIFSLSDTGSMVVPGNLAVQGNLTYNNLTNITTANLVFGLGNTQTGANVNGAGFVVGNTNEATFLYNFSSQTWTSNIGISAVGNIAGAYIIGNGSQLTGLPAGYTNSNVSSFLSAFGSNTISTTGTITSGNITGGNISATGNVTGSYHIGNGATLSSLTGANVTGTVANATYATSAGTATSATTAGTVTTNAQSNITSVGTLTSLNSGTISSSGNVTGANFLTSGSISATGNITGTNLIGNVVATTVSATGNVTSAIVNANTIYLGGNLLTINNATTPVGFRATTPVTNMTVNNGASATMLFGTEEVDTNSAYNPATGRFTPNAAGYYSIDWYVVTSANGAGELLASLHKNGGLVAWGTNQTTATAHWNGIGGSAGMIYLNGTTDYISITLTNNSGSTATILAASGLSYFSAYLIR